ncbi:hypothetical protein ABTX77_02510, partial [Streptomyces sp. NPDC097704]
MTHMLGSVTAPSGVLVLGTAGTVDCWATTDRPLSDRPLSDRPLSDRPLSDRPLSDRPLSDRPLSD